MEFIRDSAWQAVGVFVAVLIAVVTYRHQRQVKGLSVGLLLRSAIVSVDEAFAKHLTIFFEGQPVYQAELFRFGLKNTGSIPIKVGDFQGPMVFPFGTNARVLSSRLVRQFPSDLGANI